MRRFSVNLPRSALLTIYKSFIRPHLDYGDILYDRKKKLKKVKYKACLKKNWRNTRNFKRKLYEELGLHSLVKRSWCSELIYFYKKINGLVPLFIFNLYFSRKL